MNVIGDTSVSLVLWVVGTFFSVCKHASSSILTEECHQRARTCSSLQLWTENTPKIHSISD